jgi:cysteinyl-tRNA synthetase
MAIRVFNTMTGEKEDLAPLEPGRVRMYVCGITSYAPSHIGHARSAVAFDVVYRWLRRSYTVTFVRNYTDVDDKIIKAAHESGEDPRRLSERFIALYEADLERLRCLSPTVAPRVTEHIPEVVTIIERLEARGHAYRADGDVYFEVPTFSAYGRLSKRALEDQEAGARVEVDERKRSPQDFALWKAAKPGEPSWASPWGPGRPGWHIECSAMAEKYLGPVFDIHGGGRDLVFPHHENEIAQSCAANGTEDFAKVWMHNGFVNLIPEACPACGAALEGGAEPEVGKSCAACGYAFTELDFKMSKSRGNFYPVGEILDAYEGEALRLFLLTTHYRKGIAFSHQLLAEAEKRLDRNYESLEAIERMLGAEPDGPAEGLAAALGYDPRARFAEAMDDDFNTAQALAEAAEVFRFANDVLGGTAKERLGRAVKADEARRLLREARAALREMSGALGLWAEEPAPYLLRRRAKKAAARHLDPNEIEGQLAARQAARAQKDFAEADRIRAALEARGVVLRDGKEGTTWAVAD